MALRSAGDAGVGADGLGQALGLIEPDAWASIISTVPSFGAHYLLGTAMGQRAYVGEFGCLNWIQSFQYYTESQPDLEIPDFDQLSNSSPKERDMAVRQGFGITKSPA